MAYAYYYCCELIATDYCLSYPLQLVYPQKRRIPTKEVVSSCRIQGQRSFTHKEMFSLIFIFILGSLSGGAKAAISIFSLLGVAIFAAVVVVVLAKKKNYPLPSLFQFQKKH